jgi:demethylmenaquinone methyltransferase/2-methoxy-6-polyprenyl-1,4-benzoquinol methylase
MLVHEGHERAKRFFTPSNAASYDKVARLATFGQDSTWKREVIKAIGGRNSVLELACGTGVLSSMLAGAGKNVVGIDLTFEYLCASRQKLWTAVVQGTAEVLPCKGESFDAVVSSYLAKYVDIQNVVEECWRVLKPGGIAVFHDFAYPGGIMRGFWNAHFALLRVAGRSFATSWKTVFEQLDDVIKKSDWAKQTTSALYSKRFRSVSCKYYTGGTAAIVTAEKP